MPPIRDRRMLRWGRADGSEANVATIVLPLNVVNAMGSPAIDKNALTITSLFDESDE